jgi:nitronate monooxygenase
MKNALCDAGINSTARNSVFDELQGITWPSGIDGRAVANELMTDYHKGINLESRKEMCQEAQQTDDKDRLIIWAGVGAGLVNRIENASVRLCLFDLQI